MPGGDLDDLTPIRTVYGLQESLIDLAPLVLLPNSSEVHQFW